MKKSIRLLLMSMMALWLVSCGTSDGLTKAEREAQRVQQVVDAIEARKYTIAVDWMKPLGGMPRHVSSSYELKVDGDNVDSYLPYIGEAYRLPYGGGKGLNFKGKINDYKMSKSTSNRLVIEFNVTNDEDTYHYRIDMFTNGKAIIDVIAHDRDAISFDGEMVF
ncbi:MAG: DUF4251 domain-containing protein [Muribaculaceae bacterium]|nr:DUF4251 domain-containing protein [Muribaculaceae bacterium]